MKATPRYLLQLSSAEIAFLHALVRRRSRGFVAERPGGRGVAPLRAPPELVALERRLRVRLEEVTRDEEAYFGGRTARPEVRWIGEEHAALAEAARRGDGPRPAGTPEGVGVATRHGRGATAEITRGVAPEGQASNVVPLRGPGRPAAHAG